MNTRISAQDLNTAFRRVVEYADRAGFKHAGSRWVLQHGSKSNGVAFRVMSRDPEHGGLSTVAIFPNSGYLGMTKSEAFDKLHTVADTLMAVVHLPAAK